MNIAVIGVSGAIGQAILQQYHHRYPDAQIYAFSSHVDGIADRLVSPHIHYHPIDYDDEASIANAAQQSAETTPLDVVFVALGLLHHDELMPERALADLSADNFHQLFAANTIRPALIAKHFVPTLNRKSRSVFAALSARVGSVSDNRLGGWYAYRASKSALNMVLKNAAIETARRNKNAVIVGLHPGTVDSPLSKPFQRNVPDGKLFTPEYSATHLISVLDNLQPQDSGNCFAWDGQAIVP